MAGVFDYSTTANSNTTVGGVSIAEGMAPGNVNNGMRAQMADTRKWQLDWSGIVTAGASNAYTITSNQGVTAYVDGMRISFRADRNNTGAATLNVDGRGAKALRKISGGALVALAADDIVDGAIYDVVYASGDDVFVIVGLSGLQASAFMQTVLDDATAADARTTLGLVIGTDVQAADATLTSLSGLTLAAGDILYATAADTLVNLAKGTGGQHLVMNAGATAPAWTSGSRVLLASKTASNSTALAFTEFNNAVYRWYEFELTHLIPATDGAFFLMRTSTNGGSSYDSGASDYAYGMAGTDSTSTTTDASNANASIILTHSTLGVGNAANEYGVSGFVKVLDPAATAYTEIQHTINFWKDNGTQARISGGGARLAAADVDAVQFRFSTGNITSGTIRMYGIA
jgi:hypothetical protein